MSLTSYRAAPPRASGNTNRVDWKTWRRPTLPCLETQYHGRWGFSRPSSGWDRVRAPRQSHQVIQSTLSVVRMIEVLVPVVCQESENDFHAWCNLELYRAIRTSQLRALPPLHTWPINVMVYHGPRGDLVSRWVSRLDAFSGYPVHT